MEAYQRLEKVWAEWNSLPAEGMVVCSSGTAALHLALESLQLPEDSEILIPEFTIVACARAVILAGLTPIFVDCGDDLLINNALTENAYEDRALLWCRTIMPVHVYGRQCNMRTLHELAARHKLYIVEDLAEGHGIRPHPMTDAACWSFYKNKIIAGEEGGAIWFREPSHAILARKLRALGFTEAHDFRHVPRGHNYRMSNIHSELILDSIKHAHGNIAWRLAAIKDWYDELCPAEWKMPPRDVPWVYDIHIPGLTSDQQDKIIQSLNTAGIAARHAFKPMSMQMEYQKCRLIGVGNAARLSREVLYLPIHPGTMTQDTVRLAFDVIQRTLGR